jgi:CRP-like cAMP-binding protein
MLRRGKHVDVISKLPLCASLDSREIGALASIARVEYFPEDHDLIREGEPGHVFYVLLDGQAEVLIGGERLEGGRGSGDFFGEIALIAHGTRTATIRTTTPVRVLTIRDRAFRALLGREPQLQNKIVEAMGDRLAAS